MIKNRRTTWERIEKFISAIYFTDVNLYGQSYPEKQSLEVLEHFTSDQNRIPFIEAVNHGFAPVSLGQEFGPTWSTHWFRIKFTIPSSWNGKEVHLRWNSGCEALLYNKDGHPLQGFSGAVQERTDYILPENAFNSGLQTFYIEMACNTMFGAGNNSMIAPPDANKKFTLSMAEISVFDREVQSLLISLECLLDLAKELPETNPRSFDALYTANEMINLIQLNKNPVGKQKALELSENFFSKKNGETQHQIIAVGHCHIDSAWLWPYAETIRKCARSWASTLRLMEKFSDFTFACSQAQQYEWVKKHYPSLYSEIKIAVANDRFIPVGATWVEMDGNLPSGESFVRQFLYGQKYFLKEFGKTCQEFWLPDTFGYSAQLPQIMQIFGLNNFLTQKLSWNLVNKFPHHNFIWEGIDGSSVLSHFPPGESYEMNVKVKEAVKQVANLEDKGRVDQSLMLFGHGDGGGGPTEEMLLRRKLMQNVDGIAKIRLGKPSDLFEHLHAKRDKLCKWVGELFLEMHNGTYTTQAQTKQLNRQCEFLLRNLELVVTVARGLQIDIDLNSILPQIEEMWKKVLLNQFHDVLPGSSIEMVHQDACRLYKEVLSEGEASLMKIIANIIAGKSPEYDRSDFLAINTLTWSRKEIVSIPYMEEFIDRLPKGRFQVTSDGQSFLVPIWIHPMGFKQTVDALHIDKYITITKKDGYFVLSNQYLEARIANNGQIMNLTLVNDDREIIPKDLNGNQLVIFDDIPLYWDAWDVMDYHLETRKLAITELLTEAFIEENGPLKVSLKFKAKIGEKSVLTQKISLDILSPYLRFETEVDWQENHKFLKVEFPVNVVSSHATYEIQFGHLQRPNHYNTSWDWARFEVCAHKWMDLSEHNFGVAVINTSKYGHSTKGNTMTLSLLRAPKSPDANADMGLHHFTYALMPHKGTFQEAGVIEKAYELNSPLLVVPEISSISDCRTSWFEVSSKAVILEAVKISEFDPHKFVLRLYEAHGSHCNCNITVNFGADFEGVCDGMEQLLIDNTNTEVVVLDKNVLRISFKPFQIVSLRFEFKT